MPALRGPGVVPVWSAAARRRVLVTPFPQGKWPICVLICDGEHMSHCVIVS